MHDFTYTSVNGIERHTFNTTQHTTSFNPITPGGYCTYRQVYVQQEAMYL